MSTLLVNAGGLCLMAAIVWWFWLSPSQGRQTDNDHSQHQ